MLKMNTKKPISVNDTVISVRDNEVYLIFDKFSKEALHYYIKNLKKEVLEKDLKTIKSADLLTLILKKKEPSKWMGLFNNKNLNNNIEIFVGRRGNGRVMRREDRADASRSARMDRRGKSKSNSKLDISDNSVRRQKPKTKHKRARSSNLIATGEEKKNFGVMLDSIEKQLLEEVGETFYHSEMNGKKKMPSIDNFNEKLARVENIQRFKTSRAILKNQRKETGNNKVPLFDEHKSARPAPRRQQSKKIDVKAQKRFLELQMRKKSPIKRKRQRKKDAVSAYVREKSNNNSFSDLDHSANMGYKRHNPKIKLLKKDVLNVFNDLKLDVNWIKREFEMMDKKRDLSSSFIEFQHKVIKILAIKLKAERESRFKTELQFNQLTQKFAAQQTLIDDKFDN